ncbi:hypothetical protein L9F63_011858 [Diploptera punctata]|uniref:Uncharacterized protein n=1 Tax=Diploptera punctata TaxID=6984 RepID=A0AAD8AFB9_DIPPU|nr:hypothetical protein L9F63_011858 [Diploptera punctata]
MRRKSETLMTRFADVDGNFITTPYQNGDQIAEKLNRQLKYLLNQILKTNFDQVLSELSIDRLIGDSRLRTDYNEHVKQVRAVANSYVDELLSTVHDYVEVNHYEEISIPTIDAGFSKKILFITWHGEFKAENGHVRNLATLQRTADISMEYDEASGGLYVFGSIGLSELQLGYDNWSAKFMNVGPSGSLSAKVGQNSIFLKVGIIISASPTISLQDLHIEYAKDIKLEVGGLGILDFLVSTVATWVVGMFNSQIVGELDGVLNSYIVSMLSNVDVGKYFG